MTLELSLYPRGGLELADQSNGDDDTTSFENAIAAIAHLGGGQLHILPGQYFIRPINLTSHMVLYLHANTTITAVSDAAVWPVIPPLPSYGQGRDHVGPRYTSLLHGESICNVTIQGNGMSSVINGGGPYWWRRHQSGTERYTRGHLVEFLYSSHIRMHSLQLQDSPFWTNHFYDCDSVHAQDVHIRQSESSPNTDGWDPDSSRNVLIEDSTYVGGDDCVAIKSGWDCFGISYNKPCVNVTVRNVTCHGRFSGIAIGSEMSGGIENVTIENVRFTKANKPGNIKTGNMRGGYVRNVVYRNIVVDGPIEQAIHIDAFHYNDSPNPSCPADWKPSALPVISNVSFIDINGAAATFIGSEVFHLVAYNASPIQNLYMENVNFASPSSGITPWNCSGVQGSVRNATVLPWPPCSSIEIVGRDSVVNAGHVQTLGGPAPRHAVCIVMVLTFLLGWYIRNKCFCRKF